MKPYYITTAIAYTSGTPHIGNVYEIILADAIARFKRLEGYDVFFQTGTDEHGQKIELKATELGLTPQSFVDKVASDIRRIFDSVNISYDKFIRTTDDYHKNQVQKIFKRLYDQGDIYKGYYEGLYCVACESFYTNSQLVEDKCPDCGDSVTETKEEAYFLRLSNYQERLVKHIEENPSFIQPESRKNEMLNNFIKDGIQDLCVSRTSFKWGVPVSFDEDHVTYVWIDALSNYITGLGYDLDGNHSDLYKKYWPADVHLIGKDILRFHTIYWPIMLMALGEELPKQVFGHPWLLVGKGKMSKSKGNSLYTDDLVAQYGVDAIRYYVLRETPFSSDGNITPEVITERYNSELANTLSNLVNRTISMTNKYHDGVVYPQGELNEIDEDLINTVLETKRIVISKMNELRVSDALIEIMNTLRRTNKYIDETEPWILGRDEANKERLSTVLYNLLESIRHCAVLLQAFIPETSANIFNQIKSDKTSFDSIDSFGGMTKVTLEKPNPIFNRLDVDKTLAEFNERIKVDELVSDVLDEIEFDDFAKIDMRIGEVIECKLHPKADRLLISKVDIGTEVRQIVSGIAEHVKPEQFVGQRVVVVTNLKSIKLRGELSEGMILAASTDSDLEVVSVNIEKGAKVK
ncbi:methionine--tRNA ligase [Mycoplasmatota bacterium]|nr:methionine--tRNA ligase [Mycoplasmatota bacterium]